MLGVLTNPKYTGHMVWNRRATKEPGQVNPPEQWVWSPQRTHEPLVIREMFQAAVRRQPQGIPLGVSERLDATLRVADRTKTDHVHAHRDALSNTIDQLTTRQERLLTTLETQDDPDESLFARIRDRLAALERDHAAKIAEPHELAAIVEPVDDPSLLDQLPELHLDLTELPAG